MPSPQTFKNPFSVPPGRRWFFNVPGGRYVESVFGLDDCVLRAAAVYREIGEDVPANLAELIQDYMCQSLPEGFCTGKPTIKVPRFNDVLRATTAMAQAAERGGGYGRQVMQEIERRSRTCQGWPMHDLTMCVTCNGLMSAFDHYRNGRRTPFDRNVRVCRASSGLIPVMLHMDAKYVRGELPDGCWAKEARDV